MPNYQNGIIYRIVNTCNSKLYIGSTTETLSDRMCSHRGASKLSMSMSKVNTEMRRIGIEKFSISLLRNAPCGSRIELEQLELAEMNKFPIERLYNTDFRPRTVPVGTKVDPRYAKGQIYVISNTENDMLYVGSTISKLCNRMAAHRRSSMGVNTNFYTAMRELGTDKFSIDLIEKFPCENRKQLEAREFEIMSTYPRDLLYNTLTEFRKVNSETLTHLSKVMTGKKHTPEAIARMSVAQKGKIVSRETRVKLSIANAGKIPSAETRAKISLAHKGKVLSAETRAKLSIAHTGKVMSIEARAKMSTAKTGTRASVETKAKLSAMRIGSLNSCFNRGSIGDRGARWCFQWSDKGKTRSKSFGYGPQSNRTSAQAKQLCEEFRNAMYPLPLDV